LLQIEIVVSEVPSGVGSVNPPFSRQSAAKHELASHQQIAEMFFMADPDDNNREIAPQSFRAMSFP